MDVNLDELIETAYTLSDSQIKRILQAYSLVRMGDYVRAMRNLNRAVEEHGKYEALTELDNVIDSEARSLSPLVRVSLRSAVHASLVKEFISERDFNVLSAPYLVVFAER